MSTFLLFQLYGPMASWGEIAVGEVRSTADRPTKSAVLGMVAAALGITREEEEKHLQLTNHYGFAVRVDSPGSLLRDYHTAQVSTGARGRDLPTRRDELEYKSVTTILSERDYRCDAHATVCMWAREQSPPWSLDQIASALEAPKFPLFLGRKSCPLALPLHPEIYQEDTLREAFEQRQLDAKFVDSLFAQDDIVHIQWDAHSDIDSGLEESQVRERWDELRSRERWQFGRRVEAHTSVRRSPKTEET